MNPIWRAYFSQMGWNFQPPTRSHIFVWKNVLSTRWGFVEFFLWFFMDSTLVDHHETHHLLGGSLNSGTPKNTPKWSFLVRKTHGFWGTTILNSPPFREKLFVFLLFSKHRRSEIFRCVYRGFEKLPMAGSSLNWFLLDTEIYVYIDIYIYMWLNMLLFI